MHRPVIGYTLGDQAGIGPEIMRAALAAMAGEQAEIAILVAQGEHTTCQEGGEFDMIKRIKEGKTG